MKTPEWIAAPKRRNSLAVRAARLIDVLIDRAHRDWPGTSFVLSLPSGEQVFVPAHRSAGPPCALGHAGYFGERIRPFCEVDPAVHAGICSMTPLVLDHDLPTVRRINIDLSSGALTSTSHLVAAASGRHAGLFGNG